MAAESPIALIYGYDGSGYVECSIRAGIAVPSGQPGFLALGSDGTNTRYIKTSATGVTLVDGSAVTQPVSGTFWQATQPVSAASLPLPTGAATETTLATLLTTTAFQSRIPVNGQTAMASSIPVVIASNQSAIPITDNAGSLTVDGTVKVEGRGADGATTVGDPVLIGGYESATGFTRRLAVDSDGKLYIATGASGTKTTIRVTKALAAGVTNYFEYTVPGGDTLSLTTFYGGGENACRHSLIKHNAAGVQIVTNGDFESGAEVTAWAATTGTFTAPTPDSNATQIKNGSFSMRWTYASSSTALARTQTFGSAQDFSGYRYIRAWFYNDGATAANRTLTITLISGTPTRLYSTGALALGSGLPSNAWYELIFDMESPTSTTGSGFDMTAITGIRLTMQDSANKTGTVYWDYVRLVDSLDVRHRIYSAAGQTSALVLAPSEDFMAGDTIYLVTKNLGATKSEVTTITAGTLS